MKYLLSLFISLIFVGCFSHPIFTEVCDKNAIGHPPKEMACTTPLGDLFTRFTHNPTSPTKVIVTIHCAKCTTPQARSLGSDFDGYIHIVILSHTTMIARGQMDYKGEPTPQMVQKVYDSLIDELKWNTH